MQSTRWRPGLAPSHLQYCSKYFAFLVRDLPKKLRKRSCGDQAGNDGTRKIGPTLL